jgi:hypothetical protein
MNVEQPQQNHPSQAPGSILTFSTSNHLQPDAPDANKLKQFIIQTTVIIYNAQLSHPLLDSFTLPPAGDNL